MRLRSGINSLFPPKTSHSSPEPVKIISELVEPELIVTPPSNSITPTPSVDEDEEELETDDFEDDSDEFSFYRFSQRYFQDNASHTHIPYRLKKSLLHLDDEGDTLVRSQTGTSHSRITINPRDFSPHCFSFLSSPPGMSDYMVDHFALHGGYTRTQILRCHISGIKQHAPGSTQQAGQEAEQLGGTGPGKLLHISYYYTEKKNQSNYLTSSNDVISGQKILRKNKKKFDRRASSIPEEVTIMLFILSFFFCH